MASQTTPFHTKNWMTYELGLDDDDGYYDDGSPSDQLSDDAERLLKEVIFPYTKDEPNLPMEELQHLDKNFRSN